MALTKVSRGLLSTSIVDNGNATAITIDSSENVGIGVSPSANLHIYKNTTANEVLRIEQGTTAYGAQVLFKNPHNSSFYFGLAGDSTGDTIHYNGANSNSLFYTNATERMRIDSAGVTTFKYNTKVYTAGYPETRLGITDSNYFNFTFDNPNDSLAIGKNGNTKMSLTASGNLLVGTTNTANIAAHTPNIVTDLQYGINNGSNIASFGVDRINFNTSSYYVLNASVVGVRLVNGATSWTTQSDENLKENIIELTSVLDKVKDLRCVTYNLKTQESDNIKTGFIAQDWQENFSSIVHEDKDGTLGMNYTETIPVLLKAIQEQQETITALEARITQLEN